MIQGEDPKQSKAESLLVCDEDLHAPGCSARPAVDV